jgi:hypothetical protein
LSPPSGPHGGANGDVVDELTTTCATPKKKRKKMKNEKERKRMKNEK